MAQQGLRFRAGRHHRRAGAPGTNHVLRPRPFPRRHPARRGSNATGIRPGCRGAPGPREPDRKATSPFHAACSARVAHCIGMDMAPDRGQADLLRAQTVAFDPQSSANFFHQPQPPSFRWQWDMTAASRAYCISPHPCWITPWVFHLELPTNRRRPLFDVGKPRLTPCSTRRQNRCCAPFWGLIVVRRSGGEYAKTTNRPRDPATDS